MTPTSPPRLRPIRDRKELLERHEEPAAAAAGVDAEQRRLAVEFARLRSELAEVREQLWPSADGAVPVRGRALRDAALRALLRADAPLTLPEIHRALHLAGHVMLVPDPVKRLGDALGYEERRGTVRRVARGTYVIGTLTPYRRRVLQQRESLVTPTASKRSRP